MTESNQLIGIKKEICTEGLIEKGFLQETKRYNSKILVLRLPIKIKITGEIFKKYEKEFIGTEEKGGLLIFKVQNISKKKYLNLQT